VHKAQEPNPPSLIVWLKSADTPLPGSLTNPAATQYARLSRRDTDAKIGRSPCRLAARTWFQGNRRQRVSR